MQIGSKSVVPADFTLLEVPAGAVDYRIVSDVAHKVK